MSPMTFAPSQRSFRLSLGLAALLAAVAVPASAFAETGAPLPPGYTGDVTAVPQQQPVAQPPAQQPASDEYADQDPSALTDFQEPLQPYGQWVQDPTYGTIWVPDASQVGADFAPYQTNGRWETDDAGEWMWASDYSWGYIPFHYGRWVWAGSYWGWIPGRTYAPAWVSWRVGEGGYLGWAPMPPTWYWAGGYAVGLWTVPYAAYCFVPTNAVFYGNVSGYVVRDRGTVQYAAQSTRPYHPATPTAGHLGGSQVRRSPSFADAHIPASSIPQGHAAHDARAMQYATRSSTNALRMQRAATQQHVLPSSHATPRADAWHSSYNNWNRAQPALRTPQGGQTFQGTQSFHSSAPSSHYSAPSYQSAPSYHYSAPSYHSSVPSFHAPTTTTYTHPSSSSHPSAPRFTGGRVGGGRHR